MRTNRSLLVSLAIFLTVASGWTQTRTVTMFSGQTLAASSASVDSNYPPVLLKGMWSATNTPISGVMDVGNAATAVVGITGRANNSAGALTVGVLIGVGMFPTNFVPTPYYFTWALPQSNAVNTGYFSVSSNLTAIVNGHRYMRLQFLTNSHATVPLADLAFHYQLQSP